MEIERFSEDMICFVWTSEDEWIWLLYLILSGCELMEDSISLWKTHVRHHSDSLSTCGCFFMCLLVYTLKNMSWWLYTLTSARSAKNSRNYQIIPRSQRIRCISLYTILQPLKVENILDFITHTVRPAVGAFRQVISFFKTLPCLKADRLLAVPSSIGISIYMMLLERLDGCFRLKKRLTKNQCDLGNLLVKSCSINPFWIIIPILIGSLHTTCGTSLDWLAPSFRAIFVPGIVILWWHSIMPSLTRAVRRVGQVRSRHRPSWRSPSAAEFKELVILRKQMNSKEYFKQLTDIVVVFFHHKFGQFGFLEQVQGRLYVARVPGHFGLQAPKSSRLSRWSASESQAEAHGAVNVNPALTNATCTCRKSTV